MENKTIDLTNRPKDLTKTDDGYIPGCSVWIFGDEKSAENDLNKKFEVIDE